MRIDCVDEARGVVRNPPTNVGPSFQQFLVSMRLGVTPVLIPNTMVKTQAADGTALETKWESRWRPELRAYSSAG